jgi:tripartite ATP-independent transporter DctM subunit
VLHDPILLMCAAFIVFAMLRFSIALMMFGCGLVYLWASKQDIGLIVDQTLNSAFQLNVLLAIPMFILAGNVMNAATISERIWAAADAVIGRTRAGLGHVTVLMNVVISSMSGSAVSDAAGAGMVAIQMMRKVGNYPAGLAVAITAAASCLGPIIPPSIPMVIYAILSGVSVGALFLSGVIPGLLMAISLMLLIAWIGRRRGLPYGNAVPLRELPRVFGRALIRFRCRRCCSAASGVASSRRPKRPRSRRSGPCSLASASTAISEPRRSTPCSFFRRDSPPW